MRAWTQTSLDNKMPEVYHIRTEWEESLRQAQLSAAPCGFNLTLRVWGKVKVKPAASADSGGPVLLLKCLYSFYGFSFSGSNVHNWTLMSVIWTDQLETISRINKRKDLNSFNSIFFLPIMYTVAHKVGLNIFCLSSQDNCDNLKTNYVKLYVKTVK